MLFVSLLELDILLKNRIISIKDRRRTVNRLKSSITKKFNVSLCDNSNGKDYNRLSLGISAVSSSRKGVDSALTGLLEFLDSMPNIQVLEQRVSNL